MDKKKIEKAVNLIIEAIGEDPNREGLKRTPARIADMLEEILSGMNKKADDVLNIIYNEGFDEMILVKDIPFYSMCEHHFLPFIGKAHIAYIPNNGQIVGLSKLARLVEVFARRFQIQERLTSQVADAMMRILKPKGVLVVFEAEHLCMTMRGVKKPGSHTVTSAIRGVFKRDERTRSEAFNLIKK